MNVRWQLAKSTLLGAVALGLAARPRWRKVPPTATPPGSASTVRERPAEMAKQEQIPFTRFVRVQIEENAQFGFGPNGNVLNIVMIQPVIPFNHAL